MQAGVLFSGATRVWKDPYVTNQNRDDTDRRNMGAQFTWDKMFGSNLELEYSLRKIDIGSETERCIPRADATASRTAWTATVSSTRSRPPTSSSLATSTAHAPRSR